MTAQANTTVSDDPMVTQAIRCDLWPEWLGELVEKAADAYVEKYDMSTEQAVAYGILLALKKAEEVGSEALSARRATADVTEALKGAETALCDWLNTYAPDMCDPARVKEAEGRVRKRGTIAYIADALGPIRVALEQQAPE